MTDEPPTQPSPDSPAPTLAAEPPAPPLSPDPPAPPGQEDVKAPDLPLPMREDREVSDQDTSSGEAPD
jgi:hypothetical protein